MPTTDFPSLIASFEEGLQKALSWPGFSLKIVAMNASTGNSSLGRLIIAIEEMV